MPYGTWLEGVRSQERSRGVDYRHLACYASELTPYVRDQLARAALGLEEIYAHLPSLLVSDDAQREHWVAARDTYVNHVSAVVRHLGAALSAVGCTDAEFAQVIAGKETVKSAEVTGQSALPVAEEHTDDGAPDSEQTITVRVLAEKCAAGGDQEK